MPIIDITADQMVLPIGKDQIAKAEEIREKYAQGKKHLEDKIIKNFEWYKLRQWEQMHTTDDTGVNPTSAWLFNCIANKHADAMDNFPAPNILPREESDRMEAKNLSDIIPCILDQDNWEETYDNAIWYKLITGTVCYGVSWVPSKDNGLGNVAVTMVDLLNLYWEPGKTNIQDSANVFFVQLQDNESLEAQYPQLKGKLSEYAADRIAKYIHDDTIDTTGKTLVVEWYYKKMVGTKPVLHYVKYANDEVLYATENQPDTAQSGFYDDGQYPFVVDVLYPIPDQLAGFGYVDIGRSPQEYIDRMSQVIIQNGLANSRPRYFIRADSDVNEQEFVDYKKAIVHYQGNSINDSAVPIQGKPLAGIYLQVLQDRINELKETTGTRDVSTGGGVSGVTAASAIAALQEAGSKLSRDDNKSTYRAFRQIVVMIIERIRQFYTFPHAFRILDEQGAMQFITYTNAGLQGTPDVAFGVEQYRVPLFDVEVSAEKKSPYSRLSQNELALQFFGAGFFRPDLADQALSALDMMDFDRKSFVMERIATQGAMFQQAQAMAALTGMPNNGTPSQGGGAQIPREQVGSEGESSVTRNARQRVAESTTP